ncbi:MAG TPA: metallophosphoesterase family protein, partial [Terriglobales bacterium]|nr:metallophosphoesterase family protein [Terriglobales bacterium]
MRRIAALYDIHANLPALDAVLAEVERENYEALVIGGDVLPGPQPAECLARLRNLALPAYYLRGNGDRETLAAAQGRESPALPEAAKAILRDNASRLSPDDRAWIASWPEAVRLTLDGIGKVLFCHATPASDHETLPHDCSDADLARAFAGAGADLVVCGHTHIQYDRALPGVRVI